MVCHGVAISEADCPAAASARHSNTNCRWLPTRADARQVARSSTCSPTWTLIASVLHKYVAGRFAERA